MTLRTHQTGPEGRVVRRLLIEQGMDLEGAREMYLAHRGRPRERRARCSWPPPQGGMDIEEVAAKDPKAILKEAVDPAVGLPALPGAQARLRARPARGDASPKAVAVHAGALPRVRGDRRVAAGDQPVPDDAGRRRCSPSTPRSTSTTTRSTATPSCKELRDLDEEDPLEVEASKFSLNYIKLEGGNVGCMVNGAGLAMATMDIIKLAGGSPANFLDVGGGANAEQIRNAFRILLADPDVKAVLINIFGGILRCDVLAEGVIAAVRDLGVQVPVVVRMKGNNEERGKEMLRAVGPELHHRRRHDGGGARRWSRAPAGEGSAQ